MPSYLVIFTDGNANEREQDTITEGEQLQFLGCCFLLKYNIQSTLRIVLFVCNLLIFALHIWIRYVIIFAAINVKINGIQIITASVGRRSDLNLINLRAMASSPTDVNTLILEIRGRNFDQEALAPLKDMILEATCDGLF